MTVAILPSARLLDANSAFAAFLGRAKASSALGQVDWDAAIWSNIELDKALRASSGKTGEKALHFLGGKGGARGVSDALPLNPPFSDFLKAAVRLREEARPQHAENHRVMIRAGRFLHDALASDGYDPCLLLPRHFDEAARAALAKESAASAYATGKMLAELGRVVDGNNLSRTRIGWTNTIRRPSSDDRITTEAAERRARKLPSEAALDALPRIAALVVDDMDILRIRVLELLVCGGWRINELLTLPADCEVEEQAFQNGEPVLDLDGRPVIRYGIRYHAEKGFGWTIKWIPSVMVDVARRAIADCIRITQPIRDDAAWAARNPGLVRLTRLSSDPDGTIGAAELGQLLGFAHHGNGGRQWCKAKGITLRPGSDGIVTAGVRDVIDALLEGTPTQDPRDELAIHQYMFLVRDNAFHGKRAAIPGTIRFASSNAISDFITGRHGKRSIFTAFGFTEPDGSPIEMTTHQFRHWLNTIAQDGGLSQELVARWSGRKDMSQNSSYDHLTGRRLAEHVRELAEKGEIRGGLAEVRDRLPPADRAAFMETQIATAHVTEIGLCIHDWSLAPCPVHGECSNCNEHVVDKGNVEQREEVERQLQEVEMALAVAGQEVSEETYGASRWHEAHRRKRDGLQVILATHEDKSIKNGTLVHLGGRPTRS